MRDSKPTRQQSTFMATPSSPLAGKVVIVTGAVGNLGFATAQALQEANAKTILIDRSQDRLREQFPDIASSADHLLAGGADLTNPDSLARVVQSALEKFGRIDALVNTV